MSDKGQDQSQAFSFLSKIVADKQAEDAARIANGETKPDPVLDRSVRVVTHNIKTATSAMIRTQVGDPLEHMERINKLLQYWDEVVDFTCYKILEQFPTKTEISPGERGDIRNETRRIAFDGYEKGLPAKMVVDDVFALDWMSNEYSEFTQRRMPDDTEMVVLGTAAGLNRVEAAIQKTVMRQNHDDNTLEVIFGVGNEPRNISQTIFLNCRDEAKKVADYVVRDLGGSEVAKTSPVLSSFTTMHINHIVDFLERGSAKLYDYTTEVLWPDPVKKAEMIERGSLVMWLEDRSKLFTEAQINVLDSNLSIMDVEGYYSTPKDFNEKAEQFESAIAGLKQAQAESNQEKPIQERLNETISDSNFEKSLADDSFQSLLDAVTNHNEHKLSPN